MTQLLVTSVKFDTHINLWVSIFENTIKVYSRYQPIYQKGDVIKKLYNVEHRSRSPRGLAK